MGAKGAVAVFAFNFACFAFGFAEGGLMSIFWERKDELEKYEFMMGEARGRLAVTLDALTDALILVGQHGVYCTSARNPKVPALDLQAVLANITGAKELVAAVMEKLRLEKEAAE
jgi:hypothetical protein